MDARPKNDDITTTELLVGFAPGIPPTSLLPGQAKLVKAGSDLVLQLHYTANGKPGSDRSRIGLIFAKEPPKVRVSMTSQRVEQQVRDSGRRPEL